jgi:hypothetical protein
MPSQSLLLSTFLVPTVLFAGFLYLLYQWFKTKFTPQPNLVNIQAFERLTLLLERSRLQNLLQRHSTTQLSTVQLQSLLIADLQQELQHNITQQLYISNKSWQYIQHAIDQTIALINTQVLENEENSTSRAFVQKLITKHMAAQNAWIDLALNHLKSDFRNKNN